MRAGVISVTLSCSCLCLLYACSGGGSGSSSVTPIAAPTSAPSPALYPRTAGDTFAFAGQLTQTFQSFPEIAPPGSPMPEPTSVTTVNVTQTVTVKANQTFNGVSGLSDLQSAETDAQATGLKTTTSSTDTFEGLVLNGSPSQLVAYGSQFTDEAGDTESTIDTAPLVLDQIPEVAGAQWSNSPAASIDEALVGDATGSAVTVARTVNPDGSYTEKTTFPPNYSAPGFTGVGQIQENSDGSGVFSFVSNGGAITITYSPPEPQSSGASLITINEYSGFDTTVAPNATFQLPAWYGAVPTLYSETNVDQGMQTIPAACGLAASVPSQGTVLKQTISRTDTVLGVIEKESTMAYVVPGFGTVCTISTDTQTLYYDYSGDQPGVFTSRPPLEITTVQETLGLAPGSQIAGITPSSGTRSTASSASRAASAMNVAAALHANFERAVRAAHRRRVSQLVAATVRLRSTGGTR